MTVETTCRIALGAILLLACFDSGYHRVRADRIGGRVSLRHDPPWFWFIVAVSLLPLLYGIIAFIIKPAWMSSSVLPLADSIRLSGIPIGIVALLGNDWMFRHLGHNVTKTSMPRDDATLITTGPYRWVRHPMYSLGMLLFLAFFLLTANWLIGICGIVTFIAIILRIPVEEARLIEKFGDAYRMYMKRTGRFLPRTRPRENEPRAAE